MTGVVRVQAATTLMMWAAGILAPTLMYQLAMYHRWWSQPERQPVLLARSQLLEGVIVLLLPIPVLWALCTGRVSAAHWVASVIILVLFLVSWHHFVVVLEAPPGMVVVGTYVPLLLLAASKR